MVFRKKQLVPLNPLNLTHVLNMLLERLVKIHNIITSIWKVHHKRKNDLVSGHNCADPGSGFSPSIFSAPSSHRPAKLGPVAANPKPEFDGMMHFPALRRLLDVRNSIQVRLIIYWLQGGLSFLDQWKQCVFSKRHNQGYLFITPELCFLDICNFHIQLLNT